MKFIKFLFFQIFILFTLSCSNQKQEYSVELDSNWEFQSEQGEAFLPATVPGTVHLDLLENGKIQDPFFRLNEQSYSG